jgi:hypothetical protein
VTSGLTIRARAGDSDAFRELTEPHRRELQVHCYRMLGSLVDAEDALQDTLLAAWQGLGGFEGRASLRTGCTGSPPTGASTPVAQPADARPRSGTCPTLSRPSRPGSFGTAFGANTLRRDLIAASSPWRPAPNENLSVVKWQISRTSGRARVSPGQFAWPVVVGLG